MIGLDQFPAGQPVTTVDIDELRSRFPQHAGVPDHYTGLWDPGAGVIRPEASVLAALDAARRAGAVVADGARVTAVEEGSAGVLIHTLDRGWRPKTGQLPPRCRSR
ncbi:FAD-dependent oxidoreductase [Amycolatopsis alkalitolerans]|uniref:FAD-dependent oxidoreductase n=1 Tax=Amycolatopsis alkalitolerans TaxID=2547244 RepID=UPI00190F4546|nr:FAD-dependent oxidoreductase [Amycolatopsis alkalitolerans]